MDIIDEKYIELGAFIVKQAMIDYKAALKDDSKKALKMRKECKRFFLSAYGQLLSAGNGERIIKQCENEVEAEEQEKG